MKCGYCKSILRGALQKRYCSALCRNTFHYRNRKAEGLIKQTSVSRYGKGMCSRCGKLPITIGWYCTECKAIERARSFNNKRRTKIEMVNAYGGQCTCCGEKRVEFLTIDHINGNGRAHSIAACGHSGGHMLYAWLKKTGYPKEGIRLQCYNCNLSRGYVGFCPHERERRTLRPVHTANS